MGLNQTEVGKMISHEIDWLSDHLGKKLIRKIWWVGSIFRVRLVHFVRACAPALPVFCHRGERERERERERENEVSRDHMVAMNVRTHVQRSK